VEGEIASKSCSKALMSLTESSFLCSVDVYTARGDKFFARIPEL
jgi:hypothetical protein